MDSNLKLIVVFSDEVLLVFQNSHYITFLRLFEYFLHILVSPCYREAT